VEVKRRRSIADEVREIFEEAQGAVHRRVEESLFRRHASRIQKDRDYYVFVRTSPAVRAKENAQARAKRQGARLVRALSRPPCPHCGGPVTRGEVVPRGRKLPTYCSKKCMRAAIWKRYITKRKSS
jgi:hypothetical protein